MARLPRILIALIAVLAAALLLAACGGGGDDGDGGGGGEDNTAGLTPAQILERSVEAAGDLESFRLEFEATGTAQLHGDIGQLLGGGIDISGEGPVRPPDAAALDITLSLSGLPVQANITRVGDDVALGALGTSLALDVEPEVLGFLDFGAAYPELVAWTSGPRETGREDVGGTATVVIRGDIDAERAVAALAPVLGGEVDPAEYSGTATVYVGTTDLLPRRVVLELSGDAGTAGTGPVELRVRADLSDFDDAGDIVLPETTQRITPDQLGSLIGG